MNRELVDKVAKAVMYEGYMLYPYRPSAIKNRQRWSFGILYPPAYREVAEGTERSAMHSECLLQTAGDAQLQIDLRFLQLASGQASQQVERSNDAVPGIPAENHSSEAGESAVERSVEFDVGLHALVCSPQELPFNFRDRLGAQPAQNSDVSTEQLHRGLQGTISTKAEKLSDGVLKLSIDVVNTSTAPGDPNDRDQALVRAFLSAHTILTVSGGEFASLLDPPEHLREAAVSCKNVGNFPVFIGNAGERDMLLCSPIVLYDYPQIAPESAGDFYDATEMDEMLTLRVMTLTDDEKDEMRLANDHVRQLLQRTEQSAREQLIKTHGTIRSMRPVSGQ